MHIVKAKGISEPDLAENNCHYFLKHLSGLES